MVGAFKDHTEVPLPPNLPKETYDVEITVTERVLQVPEALGMLGSMCLCPTYNAATSVVCL